VLADADRGDWVLCQITSNSYTDPHAVMLEEPDFQRGSLRVRSYARPGKLFTASASLMASQAGQLKPTSLAHVIDAVVALLRSAQS
jgi:mRNA interferase MazF